MTIIFDNCVTWKFALDCRCWGGGERRGEGGSLMLTMHPFDWLAELPLSR
jgi:hypothetical protein